jgi:hypothetical protein
MMDKELFFLNVMNKTKILRPPRHTLATFGTTTFDYVLLSPLPDASQECRLREGRVTAERPKIITPDVWKKRFEGFGEETEVYKGVMDQAFGDELRALEYTFKNELQRTSVETAGLPDVANRALKTMALENAPRTTLLQGPDATWGLSLMKFIVEMSLRSYPINLRELHEHDCFDPDKRIEAQTRQRIERMFKETAQASGQPETHRALIQKLGEALKETGLFSEYEDRFFALVRS